MIDPGSPFAAIVILPEVTSICPPFLGHYPRNLAYVCHRCGAMWGQVQVFHLETREQVDLWQARESICPDHDQPDAGSLLQWSTRWYGSSPNLEMLSPELILREGNLAINEMQSESQRTYQHGQETI